MSSLRRDCAAAERHYNQEGWNSQKENTLSLLNLTQTKLQSIVAGIEHLTQNIAGTAVGNNLKWCKVSEGLYLEQESVPLGVVLCIFEARPQVLPEVAALCIASGNAAIFKGSKFNKHTLEIFHQIITDSLRAARIPEEACMMLNTRAGNTLNPKP
jgi:delta-1-pyrroline-5-carboxylate synthetase